MHIQAQASAYFTGKLRAVKIPCPSRGPSPCRRTANDQEDTAGGEGGTGQRGVLLHSPSAPKRRGHREGPHSPRGWQQEPPPGRPTDARRRGGGAGGSRLHPGRAVRGEERGTVPPQRHNKDSTPPPRPRLPPARPRLPASHLYYQASPLCVVSLSDATCSRCRPAPFCCHR